MRRGVSNVPNITNTSHIAAAMLLVNVWNLKAKMQQADGTDDIKSAVAQIAALMDDVNVFLNALEWASARYENVRPLL
jgi:hypothetical protein